MPRKPVTDWMFPDGFPRLFRRTITRRAMAGLAVLVAADRLARRGVFKGSYAGTNKACHRVWRRAVRAGYAVTGDEFDRAAESYCKSFVRPEVHKTVAALLRAEHEGRITGPVLEEV